MLLCKSWALSIYKVILTYLTPAKMLSQAIWSLVQAVPLPQLEKMAWVCRMLYPEELAWLLPHWISILPLFSLTGS